MVVIPQTRQTLKGGGEYDGHGYRVYVGRNLAHFGGANVIPS